MEEIGIAKYAAQILFGGAMSQIWPLIVLPALAALISDRAARMLPPTRADWRIAASLAAFPGLVMLMLIGMIAARGLAHMHWGGAWHFTKYHVPLILGLALLGTAVWRMRLRNVDLKRLMRQAHPPTPRLAEAAASVSIPVLELPDDSCECFVAGVFRPVAFVSRGSVARMSEPQLRAALHHERAHATSHDVAMLSFLSFVRDLAPGTERALTAYRQARERRADHEAARHVGACVLASALLAVARPTPRAVPTIGMAGPEAPTWRLQALLGVEPEAAGGSPIGLWGGMLANGGLTLWPVPHVYAAYLL